MTGPSWIAFLISLVCVTVMTAVSMEESRLYRETGASKSAYVFRVLREFRTAEPRDRAYVLSLFTLIATAALLACLS